VINNCYFLRSQCNHKREHLWGVHKIDNSSKGVWLGKSPLKTNIPNCMRNWSNRQVTTVNTRINRACPDTWSKKKTIVEQTYLYPYPFQKYLISDMRFCRFAINRQISICVWNQHIMPTLVVITLSFEKQGVSYHKIKLVFVDIFCKYDYVRMSWVCETVATVWYV
jgi:hypothetical protein